MEIPHRVVFRARSAAALRVISRTVRSSRLSSGGYGHGQYVCDHYNVNLSINVLLEVQNGTISFLGVTFPSGVGGASVGQWACANAGVCLVSTQKADGRGVAPYFRATATGAGVNPRTGPAQDRAGS